MLGLLNVLALPLEGSYKGVPQFKLIWAPNKLNPSHWVVKRVVSCDTAPNADGDVLYSTGLDLIEKGGKVAMKSIVALTKGAVTYGFELRNTIGLGLVIRCERFYWQPPLRAQDWQFPLVPQPTPVPQSGPQPLATISANFRNLTLAS